ncbi:MAG: c-type cytochrome, partial [Verrucomicrobiota bacterium]
IGEAPHYAGTGNWRKDWNRKEVGREGASKLGGGHSHCGAMIYQGTNWPATFRGKMFMCNTHGRRVNQDAIRPSGSSFIGSYEGDFFKANHSWFKGVSLLAAPNGTVYLSDWTDDGECHDNDGVHRTSGRIYNLAFGDRPPIQQDLRSASDTGLLDHLGAPDIWFARQSRRLLQERSKGNLLEPGVANRLRIIANHDQNPTARRLQAMWALHSINEGTESDWLNHSRDPEPALRIWSARFLTDHDIPSPEALERLAAWATAESHPRVQLHLASIAQRIPPEQRLTLLQPLYLKENLPKDPTLERMLWYATEPVIARQPLAGPALLSTTRSDRLKRFIARRLYHTENNLAGQALYPYLEKEGREKAREAVMAGIHEGFKENPQEDLPESWETLILHSINDASPGVSRHGMALAVSFEHTPTLSKLRRTTTDPAASIERRTEALAALLQSRSDSVNELITTIATDGAPPLRLLVLPELPDRFPGGQWLARLLSTWGTLSSDERSATIDAAARRTDTAKALLARLADGAIDRAHVSASHAQRMASLQDAEITALLDRHWGSVRSSDEARKTEIARYRKLLSMQAPAADHARGRQLYERTCAACHQLFGQGGTIGPDLTGSDRGNLDYLLTNILDPSASVATDYRLSTVALKNGQMLAGTLIETSRDRVVLKDLVGKEHRFPRNKVRKIETSRT